MTKSEAALAPNVVRSHERELWREGRAPGALGDKYQSRSFPLGKLLPLQGIGAHLEELEPGRCSCQLHHHLFEEEQFYVIDGSLTVRELTPGAEQYVEYPLQRGDLVAYAAGTGIAHQFFNRGSQTARFMAFSSRHPGDVCLYPDSGKLLLRGARTGGVFIPRGETREAAELQALAVRAAARRTVVDVRPPAHVASGAPWTELDGSRGLSSRALSRAAGARRVFASEQRLAPGRSNSELEYSVFAEALVLALSEGLVLRQAHQGVEHTLPLTPGDVVFWPPNAPSAHQLSNTAAAPARYLLISDEPVHDLIHLPETGDLRVPALGQLGRVESLDYWAGA